jgi:hypothetical protein
MDDVIIRPASEQTNVGFCPDAIATRTSKSIVSSKHNLRTDLDTHTHDIHLGVFVAQSDGLLVTLYRPDVIPVDLVQHRLTVDGFRVTPRGGYPSRGMFRGRARRFGFIGRWTDRQNRL